MQGPSRSQGPKGDINVTPLVDVVLVMLIIFMVITPMLQKGAPVKLPETENPIKAKAKDEQITLSVDADSKIYWENDQIDEMELAQRLSAEALQTSPKRVFIKGDANANYGRVRQVMKMVQDVERFDVGFITKEPEK